MTTPTLRLELADVDALRAEMETNLRAGGCFVEGAEGWSENDPCTVEIVHPTSGATISLAARVVWVSDQPPRRGVGVTFLGFSPERREEIASFIEEHDVLPEPIEAFGLLDEPGDGLEAQLEEEGDLAEATDDDLWMGPGDVPSGGTEAPSAWETQSASGEDDAASHQARHERLRGLSSTEQVKVARSGEASDRIVLERIYGKAVWVALISNPRLTPPEVARLARMGNMPRPQLEQIVANNSWLQSPQVRRALLSNPRLSQELALKVLRLLPPHELKLVPAQTAYPQLVRSAARRVLAR